MASSLSCRDFRTVNNSQWCAFALRTEDCDQDEGFIDYLSTAFCDFPTDKDENWMIGIYIIYILWTAYMIMILALTADDFFVPSLNWISKSLNLSENIAGVTFVALGNGAPDIFGAMAAFTSATADSSALAIGALLGAGAFIRLVVAGACIWVQPLKLPEIPVLRDIIFSTIPIYWLFCCLWKQKIELIDSIGFLVLYGIYIGFVVLTVKLTEKRTRTDTWTIESDQTPIVGFCPEDVNASIEDGNLTPTLSAQGTSLGDNPNFTGNDFTPEIQFPEEIEFIEKTWKSELIAGLTVFSKEEYSQFSMKEKIIYFLAMPVMFFSKLTIPIVDENDLNISWNKPLTLIQCFLIPFAIWLFTYQYKTTFIGPMPVVVIFLIISVVLTVLVSLTSDLHNAPIYYPIFSLIGFAMSILWIYMEANEVVNLLGSFGVFWNVSNTIMGILILAPANSIGDFVVDFSLAKKGKAESAMGAIYGGPLLNVLLGVGISCTIANLANGVPVPLKITAVEVAMAATVELALFMGLIILVACNFHFHKWVGPVFVATYCICLPIVLAAGLGAFGVMPF